MDRLWSGKCPLTLLTLIGEFSGLLSSAISGKNIQKYASDVTVGTEKVKLSVQCKFGYFLVLILNGICQYEGK